MPPSFAFFLEGIYILVILRLSYIRVYIDHRFSIAPMFLKILGAEIVSDFNGLVPNVVAFRSVVFHALHNVW